MRKSRGTFGVIAIACSLLGLPFAPAAETYPSESITLIVPYPPGGGIDPAARVYADELAKTLGQKIVVQNQGGASGQIGTARAARSKPDGYTLLFGSVAPNVILPAAYGDQLAYDARKDFTPIGLIAEANYVLLASASLPVSSLEDLIEYAKKQPKPIGYASSGQLSGPHLAGELLSRMYGVKLLHVPYRGNGPALTALMGDEVSIMFDSAGGVASRGESKRYKALAVTGGQPYAASPGLPDLGKINADHNVSQWYGLLAVAGTPEPVTERLLAAHRQTVQSPELQRRFQDMGLNIITDSNGAEFGAYLDAEIQRWHRLLTSADIAIPPLQSSTSSK